MTVNLWTGLLDETPTPQPKRRRKRKNAGWTVTGRLIAWLREQPPGTGVTATQAASLLHVERYVIKQGLRRAGIDGVLRTELSHGTARRGLHGRTDETKYFLAEESNAKEPNAD